MISFLLFFFLRTSRLALYFHLVRFWEPNTIFFCFSSVQTVVLLLLLGRHQLRNMVGDVFETPRPFGKKKKRKIIMDSACRFFVVVMLLVVYLLLLLGSERNTDKD